MWGQKSSNPPSTVQNMVGPGEVDEDLQPEVTEECTKYGEVSNCLVYEVRGGTGVMFIALFTYALVHVHLCLFAQIDPSWSG